MSNTSTRIKVGLISNIRTKLAANLDIDGTAISSGDWSGEITGKISEVDDEEDGNVDVVASTKGQSVPLAWAQNSKLSIDHMHDEHSPKVKNDEQRSYELVTYLTDLQLEPIHKMMTLKSELNQTVK
ncbi:unnamed protein product [Rotaria sp. Silwood1]|nr:unnamed protein product [Rotaria sp. Silwood1]